MRDNGMESPTQMDELIPTNSIKLMIERLAHWLPSQGPIQDFIHHNTLHAFQSLPFHQGVVNAAQLFGARPYPDREFFQKQIDCGRITPEVLEEVAKGFGLDERELLELRQHLHRKDPTDAAGYPGLARTGLYQEWARIYGVALESRVQPRLFKLLANFLDQGVAIQSFPLAGLSFFEAIGRLTQESFLPLAPFSSSPCKELLALTNYEAIGRCLDMLVADPKWHERYLLETALMHAGWAGMVHQIEIKPSALKHRRKISLADFLAIELILQVGTLTRTLKGQFKPLVETKAWPASISPLEPASPSPRDRESQVLLEAYEWSTYRPFLKALELNARRSRPAMPPAYRFQAIFCLDDREGSLRRHLEEHDPTIETLGAAGFFGLDFAYQSASATTPVQHCPVILQPRHIVRAKKSANGKNRNARSLPSPLGHPSHTLFQGFVYTLSLGVQSGFQLLWSMIKPQLGQGSSSSLNWHSPEEELNFLREEDSQVSLEGLYEGYTREELIQRVGNVLRSIGLIKNFAPIVVVVGHGSTSTNNPHFAAYDCGACSGRPGAPNARAFALVANLPEIRAGLAKQGIEIPSSTVFVGSVHDTTRDEILFFDEDKLPASARTTYQEFKQTFRKALAWNAQERCLKFEIIDKALSPEQAHHEARRRSAALFEPRPELNHATNMACIVGRRDLSRGLFMDRRVFLNSYDPNLDPEGNILANIFGAVVPVCGGINLEYFFSRIDNQVYGAGTKLPHNVVGLLGVANGVDSDLQTGLPSQMIEMHDPMRLIIVAEQEPEITLKAATKNSAVLEWIKNEWIYLTAISPSTGRVHVFRGDKFVPFDTSRIAETPMLRSSKERQPHKDSEKLFFRIGEVLPC